MNILVPVDFSPCSDNALRYALSLAGEMGAKVFILHAYRLTKPFGRVNTGSALSIREELDRETQKEFEQLKQRILKGTNVDHEVLIDIGFAADTIASNIKDNNIDLVIMGTKGNGMIHQIFGSTTLNVIKKVNCPVLTIPISASFSGLKEIAIASDYSEKRKIKAFKTVKKLSRQLNSHIHVLSFNSSNRVSDDELEKGELKLNKYFPKHDLHYHFRETSDVEQGLNELIENLGADMLVLIPRDKDLFRNMFAKSITKNMVLHSNLPIMALTA